MRALASAFLLGSLSCGGGGPAPWIAGARILVHGVGVGNQDCRAGLCQHDENTDLIRWYGAIFLVHRTAVSQVLGPNSALHIYRSDDGGKTFAQTAVILAPPDRDLRDPHFYVPASGAFAGALHIKALTRLPVTSARDSDVQTIAVMARTTDGASWSALQPIAPAGWSFWRVRGGPDGALYSAAYQDGDKSVVLYRSPDGASWTAGPLIYGISADTPLETELLFAPRAAPQQPLLLALVRMDGADQELLGARGRLRTKICTAEPPYDRFDCASELSGQRLDGPAALFWRGRLFVVARKHLGEDGRKRTSLFELPLAQDGATPTGVIERGELPSAGDTAYAGIVMLDEHRLLVSWYSSDLRLDPDWVTGILGATDIWTAVIDLAALKP
jgi:hypothetical protein